MQWALAAGLTFLYLTTLHVELVDAMNGVERVGTRKLLRAENSQAEKDLPACLVGGPLCESMSCNSHADMMTHCAKCSQCRANEFETFAPTPGTPAPTLIKAFCQKDGPPCESMDCTAHPDMLTSCSKCAQCRDEPTPGPTRPTPNPTRPPSFPTPLPTESIRSCRHSTFVDAYNPKRMWTGSYCADGTSATAGSNGSILSPQALYSCRLWKSGGGGFTPSSEVCPAIASCRHSSYVDSYNPKRMWTGYYCTDNTGATAGADGSITTQAMLNQCASWTSGGGGFTPSPDACPAVRSCRHTTYVESNNPKRMWTGSYCVDGTAATAAADGSVMSQKDLNDCKTWPGFTPSVDMCPAILSCQHATYVDTANPKRMSTGYYCADGTYTTAAADGSVLTQHVLNSCMSWTTGGGGFTPHTALCAAPVTPHSRPNARSATVTGVAQFAGRLATMDSVQEIVKTDEGGNASSPAESINTLHSTSLTCADVWNTDAGGHSCGNRIQLLLGNRNTSAQEAKDQVAADFPSECGACSSSPFRHVRSRWLLKFLSVATWAREMIKINLEFLKGLLISIMTLLAIAHVIAFAWYFCMASQKRSS